MKAKPVCLRNYHSNKTIRTKSITDFCRKARLYHNAKYHFADVLNGKRLHHKGWMLPERFQPLTVYDINGNKYNFTNPLEFGKKMGISPMGVLRLINKEIPIYRKLYIYDSPAVRRKLIYCFKSGNKELKSHRVSEIADKIGVHRRNLYYVLAGERAKTHGWTLKSIEPTKEKVY